MILNKGDIIKNVKKNNNKNFENTIANAELVYKVIRVNPKTYGLKCIEGYMEGTRCNLSKDFQEHSVDIYGTVSDWIKEGDYE